MEMEVDDGSWLNISQNISLTKVPQIIKKHKIIRTWSISESPLRKAWYIENNFKTYDSSLTSKEIWFQSGTIESYFGEGFQNIIYVICPKGRLQSTIVCPQSANSIKLEQALFIFTKIYIYIYIWIIILRIKSVPSSNKNGDFKINKSFL